MKAALLSIADGHHCVKFVVVSFSTLKKLLFPEVNKSYNVHKMVHELTIFTQM